LRQTWAGCKPKPKTEPKTWPGSSSCFLSRVGASRVGGQGKQIKGRGVDYGEQDKLMTMLKEGEVLFKLLLRRLFFFIHLFVDNTKKRVHRIRIFSYFPHLLTF
jgi:hypothetical protein